VKSRVCQKRAARWLAHASPLTEVDVLEWRQGGRPWCCERMQGFLQTKILA